MNNTTEMMSIATTTGLDMFHPEMGETRAADAVIDAHLSHYGNHYFIKTPLTLAGRGIVHTGTLQADQLTADAQHKAGWNEYKVTVRAFDRLCEQHKVSMELLLD